MIFIVFMSICYQRYETQFQTVQTYYRHIQNNSTTRGTETTSLNTVLLNTDLLRDLILPTLKSFISPLFHRTRFMYFRLSSNIFTTIERPVENNVTSHNLPHEILVRRNAVDTGFKCINYKSQESLTFTNNSLSIIFFFNKINSLLSYPHFYTKSIQKALPTE